MSVFKSFSKVLSQATLNSQNKTYILTQRLGIQNPVLPYLSQPAASQDIFQLSLTSYHLVRKTEVNKNLLKQLEGENETTDLGGFKNTLTEKSDSENRLALEYVDRLASVLNSGVTNLPVDNAIKALYAFEATNRSDVEFYKRTLFPVIREKIAYASLNNLIELTSVLSQIKHFEDKALWEGIVKQLGEKFNRPGPQYVKYTGWEMRQYEEDSKGPVKCPHNTETERYFNDVKNSGKLIGSIKHEIRQLWDSFSSRILYNFFLRQRGLTGTADSFPETLDRERLRVGLEGARSAGINVDDVIGRLKIDQK